MDGYDTNFCLHVKQTHAQCLNIDNLNSHFNTGIKIVGLI